jgi:site-specific DNA-methyltransferase (adenine-specific)
MSDTHELIMLGDCIQVMRNLPDACIDAVITDPPYGIGFMGKPWDGPAIREAAERDRLTRSSLGPESASRPGRAQPRSSSAFGNAAIIAGPVRGGRDFQDWCEAWAAECLRLLKPGGHLVSFGGTRTNHRLASGIEDAGFEIRDTLAWLYGSGFPKSLDVSKAIDKAAGATREVVGERAWSNARMDAGQGVSGLRQAGGFAGEYESERVQVPITAPATPDAATWQGWGTALKPAHEPITLARKPIRGTIAANVLAHGTGALNIDACRIGDEPITQHGRGDGENRAMSGRNYAEPAGRAWSGRWPANVILSHHPDCLATGETRSVKSDGHHPAKRGAGGLSTSGHAGQEALDERHADGETVEVWECHAECAVRLLDEQTGELHTHPGTMRKRASDSAYFGGAGARPEGLQLSAGDKGGASRFYYCAKASKRERGGEHNTHPTVKPLALMRWLVRLVAPPGALILDPFLGSGTTALACIAEGVEWVGIEQDSGYAEIATQRIRAAEHEAGVK